MIFYFRIWSNRSCSLQWWYSRENWTATTLVILENMISCFLYFLHFIAGKWNRCQTNIIIRCSLKRAFLWSNNISLLSMISGYFGVPNFWLLFLKFLILLFRVWNKIHSQRIRILLMLLPLSVLNFRTGTCDQSLCCALAEDYLKCQRNSYKQSEQRSASHQCIFI